ncbi:hypothetical protein Tco_0789042 [Tanacetum coccineum]
MVIESFLITNNLMGYVDGSIPCPSKTLSIADDATVIKENPNYPICVSNNAHVHMLIISTVSKASFRHVQGTTSHDLWLSLEKAYAPHSTSRYRYYLYYFSLPSGNAKIGAYKNFCFNLWKAFPPFTPIELYTFLSQLRHRLGNLGETFDKSLVVTGKT